MYRLGREVTVRDIAELLQNRLDIPGVGQYCRIGIQRLDLRVFFYGLLKFSITVVVIDGLVFFIFFIMFRAAFRIKRPTAIWMPRKAAATSVISMNCS